MVTKWLFPALLGLVLAAPAIADTIYRWVDADGQVHYSDVPRDGAKEVELSPASTFSLPASTRVGTATSSDTEQGTAGIYQSLDIASPSSEETIWNTGGIISVSVSHSPALKPGHSINIYYDGQLISGKPPKAKGVELSEVFRGSHTLSAAIVDTTGRSLISAPPITFYYKQATKRP